MALTKEDLQAIGTLLDSKLEPLQADVSGLKADVTKLYQGQEKLQADVSELKADVTGLKADVTKLYQGQEKLQADVRVLQDEMKTVKKSVLLIELVHIPKIEGALEGILNANEKYDRHDARIEALETKVEMHDVMLA